MKKYKYILLIIMIFILTGCSVDYSLNINSDEKVEETVIIITNNNDLTNAYGGTIKNAADMYINSYKVFFKEHNIKSRYNINDNETIFYLTKTYENLEEYANSVFFTNLYQSAIVNRKNSSVRFSNAGDYYGNILFGDTDTFVDNAQYIDDLNITMKFQNKIITANADESDEENNIYKWHINKKEFKNIVFEVSNEKRYDIIIKEFLETKIIYIEIGLTISAAVIITALYFYIHNKRINKL